MKVLQAAEWVGSDGCGWGFWCGQAAGRFQLQEPDGTWASRSSKRVCGACTVLPCRGSRSPAAATAGLQPEQALKALDPDVLNAPFGHVWLQHIQAGFPKPLHEWREASGEWRRSSRSPAGWAVGTAGESRAGCPGSVASLPVLYGRKRAKWWSFLFWFLLKDRSLYRCL